MGKEIVIRRAEPSEVVDLRHKVLRAHQPRHEAIYKGDDLPSTQHFVALLDGAVIGIATTFLNTFDGSPARQLRGMAVDPAHRSQGIGSKLLTFLAAAATDVPIFWCNARTTAIPFYERAGWIVASPEVFDVPPIGPHVKMIKRLPTK